MAIRQTGNDLLMGNFMVHSFCCIGRLTQRGRISMGYLTGHLCLVCRMSVSQSVCSSHFIVFPVLFSLITAVIENMSVETLEHFLKTPLAKGLECNAL